MSETFGLTREQSLTIFEKSDVVTNLVEGADPKIVFHQFLPSPRYIFSSPVIAILQNSLLPTIEELDLLRRFTRSLVLSLNGTGFQKMEVLGRRPAAWGPGCSNRTIVFANKPSIGWRCQLIDLPGYYRSVWMPGVSCSETLNLIQLFDYINKRRKVQDGLEQVVNQYLHGVADGKWSEEQFAIDNQVAANLGYGSIIGLNAVAESFDPPVSVFPWHDFWVNYVRCHKAWKDSAEVQLSILREVQQTYEKGQTKYPSDSLYEALAIVYVKYLVPSYDEFDQLLQQSGVATMVDEPCVAIWHQLYSAHLRESSRYSSSL